MKALTLTIAVCAVSATAALSTPASAENGRNAAAIGGLAAGALIGGAIANQQRYADPYPPRRVYEEACHIEREPVVNRWGEVVSYRRVRVCE